MKKLIALLLAVVMLLAIPSFAEEMQDESFQHLTIATVTPMNGNFLSSVFGSNTSDLDVQKLLHGYSPVDWVAEMGAFQLNEQVATALVVTDNAQGDRTYTITLQTDLCYSDGTPITAWDYAFGWLLNASPLLREIGANGTVNDTVLGIEAYTAGEADSLEGVKVLDDHRFSITVGAENLPFFYELGILECYPYPMEEIAPDCQISESKAETGTDMGVTIQGNGWTAEALRKTLLDPENGYVSHPNVVSGAYTLVSFDGTTAEFETNPYYKGDRVGNLPQISTVTFTYVPADDMLEALTNGDVDLLHKVTRSDVITDSITMGSSDFRFTNYVRTGMSFVAFCCEKPTVSEQEVRQAIALCLDRETLTAEYTGNYGLTVNGYYGIGQWMYQILNGTMAPPVEDLAEDATRAEEQAYEEALAAWEELTMDELPVLSFDPAAAAEMLEKAGWTLNQQGQAYTGAEGEIRSKQVEGQLVTLDLHLIYPETNQAGVWLEETFADSLSEAGIGLTCQALPMDELLSLYYRTEDRDCDLIYLASNFSVLFDPSGEFAYDGENLGTSNHTAVQDKELYQLALQMRSTEPGDLLTYCTRWLAFQNRFLETLPMIPVYGNVYFDVYESILQNYQINANVSWSEAIVGAYLGDAADEEEELEEEEDFGDEDWDEEFEDEDFEFFD